MRVEQIIGVKNFMWVPLEKYRGVTHDNTISVGKKTVRRMTSNYQVSIVQKNNPESSFNGKWVKLKQKIS